jgi:hypothetical protein
MTGLQWKIARNKKPALSVRVVGDEGAVPERA